MTGGLMIAAPRSGSGKTTVTLALLAAFRRQGVAVRAAKSGPDYIDPAFHAAATGWPSLNLDLWAMPPALVDSLAASATRGAALLVVESAMGLFDGLTAPPGQRGSPADLAAHLGLPVVLVIDVSGQSQSAAATARGFALHDPRLRVAGVILNQVASPRHRAGIEAAMAEAGIAVLGCVMRDASLALPERHLGLVQAGEHGALPEHLARLADLAERSLDLPAIRAAAASLTLAGAGTAAALPPPGQRIALARDDAFSFIYPHLVQSWREAGASIVPFSPLADDAPPGDCDAAWLPGGYPELHAPALAAATRFRDGLRDFARTRPVHGECGGFMVLGETLETQDGTFPMAGLLGHATSFVRRRLNLGYREATLAADGPLGPAGSVLRGHEFHYACTTAPGADASFCTLRDGLGQDLGPAGGRRGRVTGSFFHAIARTSP
jgi:cobyrinic acid a,c-diamide synthase